MQLKCFRLGRWVAAAFSGSSQTAPCRETPTRPFAVGKVTTRPTWWLKSSCKPKTLLAFGMLL